MAAFWPCPPRRRTEQDLDDVEEDAAEDEDGREQEHHRAGDRGRSSGEAGPDHAELTRSALKKVSTHRVVWVKDGQEALDFLHRQGPWASHTGGSPSVILPTPTTTFPN